MDKARMGARTLALLLGVLLALEMVSLFSGANPAHRWLSLPVPSGRENAVVSLARSRTFLARAARRAEVRASMPSTPSTPSMGIGGGISVGQNTLMNEATGGEGRGGARTRIPSTRTTLGVVGTSTTITTTTIAE